MRNRDDMRSIIARRSRSPMAYRLDPATIYPSPRVYEHKLRAVWTLAFAAHLCDGDHESLRLTLRTHASSYRVTRNLSRRKSPPLQCPTPFHLGGRSRT